ncbi:MAG: hypothetical protein AB7S38_27630 [Vulcanimicrobiota bacterium]
MHKQKLSLLLALVCLGLGLMAAPGASKEKMKTHSSTAKGAKVTVVHFGAPW